MDLQLGSFRVPVVVSESGTTESKSTGRMLSLMTVEFSLRGEEMNELAQAAIDGGAVTLVGPEDEPMSFLIGDHSESYSDQGPDHHYRFEVAEVERVVVASAIRVGDLTLLPEDYEETTNPGLCVTFTTVISRDEQDRLYGAFPGRQYVDVVREGVNESPVPMRRGLWVWQDDGETVRQHVVLVHRDYDEVAPPLLTVKDVSEARVSEQLCLLSAQFARLLETLQDARVLDEARVESILDVPEDDYERRERELSRVDDLGEFLRGH